MALRLIPVIAISLLQHTRLQPTALSCRRQCAAGSMWGVQFPVYLASSQSRLGGAECRGSWADEVRRRPAEEPVHAAPRAAHYEAMTELPDPVDQDQEEVLTIGGRPWRPRSRQGVITIIAAIAIAAGVLTGLLVTRQHTAASHPAPPGSVGVHPPTPLGASDTSGQRTTLQGSPVTGATGVQLLISRHLGWPLAWFSLDSGTLAPLDLPPNVQLYRVQAFPGGVLLRPDTTPPCDGCPGPPAPVYYAASGSPTVTRVGFANWDAAVTADHAAAWLSSYQPATDPYSGRSQTFTAHKVDLSGHPLGPPTRLPSGYLPAGDTLEQPASGLLLRAWTNPHPTGTDYTLWDPSSRTVTATYGSVIAVSAHQIAWTASSRTEANCPLHLTDPSAGTTSTQPLPPGQMPTLGSYSPDGHHLALLLLTAPPDASASPVEIALLNAATHRLTVIPGTDLDIIPTLNWSTDGQWLLITSLGRQQIGLINPHTRRLQVATVPD